MTRRNFPLIAAAVLAATVAAMAADVAMTHHIAMRIAEQQGR